MDTHKHVLIEQQSAKDLSVIQKSSHPKISHVQLLGVTVFYAELNMLRI